MPSRFSGFGVRRRPPIFSGFFMIIPVIIIGVIIVMFAQNFKISYRTVTVCDKERVTTQNDSSYRVYTTDGKDYFTYEVKDNLLVGGVRFRSADFYGRLKRGTTYDVKLKGFRLGFVSIFPNILEAKKTTAQHPEWCDG